MAGSDRYDMDLHEYLIRKSKATDKVCFVLESAKKNVRKTLRIGFTVVLIPMLIFLNSQKNIQLVQRLHKLVILDGLNKVHSIFLTEPLI